MTHDFALPPIKILVVDDEADLHLLVRQRFKRQQKDWSFVFASDGVEALAMLEADAAINLVLTDINMPRMDGLTLLRRIGAMERPLRVVIVSAYGDMDNIRAAMNLGAFDFVTKPVNLDDLVVTIEKTWQAVQVHLEGVAAQQQLAEARKALAVAEQVQALKARFFANLSHEFRTPLTLILGPLQDALHGDAGALDAASLGIMHRHAERLKRLIDQLLDLSKLEASRMTLRAGRHDLVSFLRDLVQAFTPGAERKQITLHFVAGPQEAYPLYFEPDKLEKIVGNLLSNALKFTPAQGTVRVRVRPFEDTHLDIEVRDSGPGIPSADLPYLFERFHRVDTPGLPAQPGTGIGLSLAKELTELHGGTIFAESEEGFGATFTVRLQRGKAHLGAEDLDEEEQVGLWGGEGMSGEVFDDSRLAEAIPRTTPSTSSQPDTQKSSSVLVVEDNTDVRAYLKRHLASRYRVFEAADGKEALVQARAEVPDLVISDVMMPHMDGLALCRALKADEGLRHIPIILLTARASEDSKLEGLETGADDYLNKPFNARELLVRAENLIEIRRLLREQYGGVRVQASDVDVSSADEVMLAEAQAFAEAHMGERGFEVAQVADAVGLSPRQFRRKVRALTGLSAAGFVRTLRLQRAAQLIEKQAGTVSEIAYRVGFKDAKYFSRLFRQVYGALPSEYGRSDGHIG